MIEQQDCIKFCSDLKNESIDLLYTDPPFGTGKLFSDKNGEYKDLTVKEMESLLCDLSIVVYDKIKPTGVVAIHVDHRLSHKVRNILDNTLGERNFVNEIIWSYKTGGSTNKRFSRKHDSIIVYSKSKNHKFNPIKERSYNRDFKPYKFKGVEEFQDSEGKWYTLVNMKDVWSDIPAVGRTSGERVNYPTQKPLALADRIISAFTNQGDVVLDPFCGSGTHIVSAIRLGRFGFGCDLSLDAVNLTKERIL